MTVEIKTLGTSELAAALDRANPYEVYKDVAIRMKDGGFTEKPTLTRALEMISPTEASDKSGLDAFDRLMKARGIVTNSDFNAGYYASNAGIFMRSSVDKMLFAEFCNRQWRKASTLDMQQRATLLSDDATVGSWARPWFDAQTPRYSQQVTAPIPLSELVAVTTPIDSDAYRATYLTYSATNLRQYRVGEGAEIPIANLSSADQTIRLYKFGRGLRATYEELRRIRVDKLATFIMWLAIQAEIDKVAAAIDVIVSGDGNNNAATSYNLTTLDSGTTANNPTFKAWQALKMKFAQPYTMTTAVMQDTIALQIALLNTGSANIPLVVQGNAGGLGTGITPINQFSDGVRYGWTSDAPANKIVAFDKNRCLEHVVETGSEIAEQERYVTNQTQVMVMSQVEGFSILDKNANKVMATNA